ncbi:hypothetical protein OKW34_004245 [Paraburkholderia youngii]
MNVETPFETNAQFAETGKPCMRALDHSAMPPEPLLAFHAATGNTGRDSALLQVTPTAGKVIALVRMQLARGFAGWPFRPETAGMASSVGSNAIESCRLAPVTVMASGMLRASTTMCRFDPSFPRSVGMGPVSWPPGGWQQPGHQAIGFVSWAHVQKKNQQRTVGGAGTVDSGIYAVTQRRPSAHS